MFISLERKRNEPSDIPAVIKVPIIQIESNKAFFFVQGNSEKKKCNIVGIAKTREIQIILKGSSRTNFPILKEEETDH